MHTHQLHRFAPHLCNPAHRQAYMLHQCGLCHALGDGYGLLARLFTGHELTLLNALTTAQMVAEPTVAARHCPLNPLLQVRTNPGPGSALVAAVAVQLARLKLADDVVDSGGQNLRARAAAWATQPLEQKAAKVLQTAGLDTAFAEFTAAQAAAERDPQQDGTAPSSALCARLFALTAHLAQAPENAALLAEIGAHYGAYIYLLDAYRDVAADAAQGQYNPLVRLGAEGRPWLHARLAASLSASRRLLPQVRLHRYASLLAELLYRPLETLIRELEARPDARPPLPRLQWAELLKIGLFVLPAAIAGAGLAGAALPQLVEAGDPGLSGAPGKRRSSGVDCAGADCSGVNCSGIFDTCTHTQCNWQGFSDCCSPSMCQCTGRDVEGGCNRIEFVPCNCDCGNNVDCGSGDCNPCN